MHRNIKIHIHKVWKYRSKCCCIVFYKILGNVILKKSYCYAENSLSVEDKLHSLRKYLGVWKQSSVEYIRKQVQNYDKELWLDCMWKENIDIIWWTIPRKVKEEFIQE